MENLTKISDAARNLGISRQTIYNYISEGRIKTFKKFGITVVDEYEIISIFIDHKRGRPRKEKDNGGD